MQIVLAQCPGAPAFHLLKVVLAPHIPHKNQALNGLYICPSGNHVHRDSDTGIEAVAEVRKNFLRSVSGVGNFLTEFVALAKFLTDDLNNVICMAISLGKDQRLGDLVSTGEQSSIQVFLKRADHSPYLAGVHNIPIQPGWYIADILVHLLPALFAGQAVPIFDLLLDNVSAALSDLCFNQENVFPHIYAVNNCLFSGIFTDHILVEKGKGALVRRSGQTDDERIKILQYLAPDIVNRAVALIRDDAVKKFRRVLLVINYFFRSLAVSSHIFVKGGLLSSFV